MPPQNKKPTTGTSSSGKKKKQKQPTQTNPNGTRIKVIGADGKTRWEWR